MNPKEKWINETLESLDSIKRAEGDPLLFEKLSGRLRHPGKKITLLTPRQLLQLAAGLALLLSLNIFSLICYTRSATTVQNNVKTLAGEYFTYLNTIKY